MVVPVGVAGDEVALAVALEFVSAELAPGIGRPGLVDDDFAPLQPLHPIVHAAGALHRLAGVEAETAVVRHTLGLRAVTSDHGVGVAPGQELIGRLTVCFSQRVKLVRQEDRLPCRIIVQADEGVWVGSKAPVEPLSPVLPSS